MSKFGRAVTGVGQFSAIVLIFVITFGGGVVGYRTVDVLQSSAPGFVTPALMQHMNPALVGIGAGAIIGFLVSTVFASIVFGIAEIAKNTSDRWFP